MSPTHDSFSPENQRRLNHDAAVRNGEHIAPEFEFSDLDLSGRKNVYRPGFEKAIRALLDRRIKALYVAKLDRLTRKGMGHVGLILDELEQVGGRIVFVAEGLDTSKPGARQVIAILAEQARAESDAISWRIGQWHAHNRRMGLWKARRPFGYVVVDGKLKPHPVEAPIARRVVEDFLGGSTYRAIARTLNEEGTKPPRVAIWYEEARGKGHRVKKPQTETWSWNGVKKLLTQPVLAGLISHNRKLVYDEQGDLVFAGEGIITLAERARILAEMERRSTIVRNADEGRAHRHAHRGWTASQVPCVRLCPLRRVRERRVDMDPAQARQRLPLLPLLAKGSRAGLPRVQLLSRSLARRNG